MFLPKAQVLLAQSPSPHQNILTLLGAAAFSVEVETKIMQTPQEMPGQSSLAKNRAARRCLSRR